MRAKLIYIGKAVARRVRYGPEDLFRSDRELPPRHLSFVGGGDFAAVGQTFAHQFVELGGLTPDADVLDIGCGIGRMAIPLTDYLAGGSYRGFDVGREMIRWNERHITPRHPDFRFSWAPIYNQKYNPFGSLSAAEFRFPYEDDRFDFVFATSLFTHLVPDEARHYLAEAARVLRPGGRAFFTFFLLTDHARTEIREGRAGFPFTHPVGEALAVDPRAPEEAIAYEAEDLSRFLDDVGLRLARPPYFGSWSNSPGAPSVQDLVVVETA